MKTTIRITAAFNAGPLAGRQINVAARFPSRDAAAKWLRQQRRQNRLEPRRGKIISLTTTTN